MLSVTLLPIVAFSLPTGSTAWASKHFDDEMTSNEDEHWRDQYATGSVFVREYEDSQGYATDTESMMAYVLDMFPNGVLPKDAAGVDQSRPEKHGLGHAEPLERVGS